MIGQGPVAGAQYVPAITVLIACLLTALPIVSTSGWYPDLGFLFLIAWRLLRADVWPAWWAAPLGLFNDLVTGHPVGFSIAVWTAAMLLLDLAGGIGKRQQHAIGAPVVERFDRVVAGLFAQEQLQRWPLPPQSRQDARQEERRDRGDHAHPQFARERLARRLDEGGQLLGFAEKAMRRLSGDHDGLLSPAFSAVILRGAALPSAGTSHRSLVCSFSS